MHPNKLRALDSEYICDRVAKFHYKIFISIWTVELLIFKIDEKCLSFFRYVN